MEHERRDSYRIEIEEWQARLDIPSEYPAAKLIELSAGGGVLDLRAGRMPLIGEIPAFVRLGTFPRFDAQIAPVHSAELGSTVRVGVRFSQVDQEALRSLSRFLIDRFLERSTRISRLSTEGQLSIGSFSRDIVRKALLYYAILQKQRLRVYRKDLLLPLQLVARDLDVEAAREILVADVLAGTGIILEAGREYTFAFSGSGALHTFKTTVWRVDPRRIWLVIPPDIRAAGFRDSPRASLRPAKPLLVAFRHPRLPGLVVGKCARDISARGLSFAIDPARDLLFPGERIEELVVFTPGEPVIAKAMLRSIWQPVEGELVCGVELLSFLGDEGAERWKRYVFYTTHPKIRLIGQEGIEHAWDALGSSGYVGMIEKELRTGLEEKFLRAWTSHVENRNVSRFFLINQEGRSVATAAASLLYPRTWLPHLFGIDERERKRSRQSLFDFAREANSGIMYLLQHMTDTDNFVFYFDAGKPFHEKTFGRFLERYPNKEEFIYDGFSLYKCILGSVEPSHSPVRESLRVVGGNPDLHMRLSSHLRLHLSEIEFDAFCYNEREITLEAFSGECARQGYERERRIFFALERDEPVAALIAETGDEGINIFGLLNKCWLVYLDPKMAFDEQVKQQLLLRAIRLFASREKSSFLFLGSCAGEPERLLEAIGLRHMADGQRWLARRSIIPAFVNHVRELMGMAMEMGP